MKLNLDISSKIVSDSSEYANKQLENNKTDPLIMVSGAVNINEMTDENGKPTSQAYQIAVNKLNEFMEHNQRNSKFIFHEDLERYYIEMVDASTQVVVKEIPAKELLDAYYEMQKLAGKIFDTQI